MAGEVKCVCCGENVGMTFDDPDNYPEWACDGCQSKYPPSLIKACGDTFMYALGLRNGLVLEFNQAKIKGNWVTISSFGGDHEPMEGKTPNSLPFPRGIDIRLDEIIWCADAPRGS